MSRWTKDRSALLSLLLDQVTGTKEATEIRQDFCKLQEFLMSTPTINVYYTGSRAEGLSLPGSDDDFMIDINNLHHVKVVQSSNKPSDTSSNAILYLHTENVRTGLCSSGNT